MKKSIFTKVLTVVIAIVMLAALVPIEAVSAAEGTTARFTTTPDVAAGNFHTVALKKDGTVWAWGQNRSGELGDGTTTNHLTPVQVQGLGNVTAITATGNHTVALKSDGTVWAWGGNEIGQLGDGTKTNRTTPVQVQGLSDVKAIATGSCYTVALKKDGTVWTWGLNDYGQLGDGSMTNRTTPVQVQGLSSVSGIAPGAHHTLVSIGFFSSTIKGWGYNVFGQLGDGTTINRTTPVTMGRDYINGITIYIGGYHNVVRKSGGTIWTWGWNTYGQLGDGTTIDNITPVQVKDFTVSSIWPGMTNNFASKNDRTIWAWGRNDYGQLGDGSTVNRATPVQVQGLNNVKSIIAEEFHTVALKDDGTIWTWGFNTVGQLGDGTKTDRHTPVQVNGANGVGFFNVNDPSPSQKPEILSVTASPTKGDTSTLFYFNVTTNNAVTRLEFFEGSTGYYFAYMTGVNKTSWKTMGFKQPANVGYVRVIAYNSSGEKSNPFNVSLSVTNPQVTGLAFSQSKLYMVKGKSVTLPVAMYKESGANANLTWKSGNTSIATVTQSGQITGKKAGSTTIKVTAPSGKSAFVTVYVAAKASGNPSIDTLKATKTMKVGGTQKLTATIKPAKATGTTGAVIKWKSHNTSIIKIDAAGKVTALKKGQARITASVGVSTYTITIKVE